MLTKKKTPFDANGTEGMLDVVLGCTLIFLLLTALIKVEAGKTQEIVLPDMDLTQVAESRAAGADSTKRTIISLRNVENTTQLWMDDREVSPATLQDELRKLGPAAHVAIRRDRELPCKVEDEIILACQEAGIQRVAIMIQQKEK